MVTVSWDCHGKLPQIRRLKMKKWELTVLETTSLKSGCWQGHTLWRLNLGDDAFLPLPKLLVVAGHCWHYLAYRYITPVVTWGSVSVSSLSLLCLFFFLIRTPVIGFRAYTKPSVALPWLVTSAKVLFPNKVTFRGSRMVKNWRGGGYNIQPHIVA